MQAWYYDRDGRPVSEEQWQELGREPGYSRIGYADGLQHGQQVTVVTFWSGIGGHGPHRPLLFCTCAGIRPMAAAPTSGCGDGPTSLRPAPGTRPSPPGSTRCRVPGRPRKPALRTRPGPAPSPVRYGEQAARDGTPRPAHAVGNNPDRLRC